MDAIYARVSTDEQAKTGYSLGDQVSQCRHKLLSLGFTNIKEYIDDGYSGEFLDRPHLDHLRDDLRHGHIKNIVVYDPDRLSRNLTNQLLIADEIEKAGAQLMFVTGDYDCSPEGRLFFSIRGAIAAFEKAKIRERTMRGKRAKALSGKLVFNDDAYGYAYDSEACMYVINADEAIIIRLIFDLYTSRMYGVNSLRAELKALGIVNRKGEPFNASTLHRMLVNETYAGIKWAFKTYDKAIAQKKRKKTIRDQSEWIPIIVPAIISRETWEKTIECRRHNKATAKRNTKYEYLLQNIIRCEACGYAMHGVTYPRRNSKDYSYYVCTSYINGHECPDKKNVPSKELEEAVWSDLLAMAKKKKGFSVLHKKDTDQLSAKIGLEKQLENLRKRTAAIIKWVANGTININDAERDLLVINKEIASAQLAINKIITLPVARSIKNEDFINAETFEQKRRALLNAGIKISTKREDSTTVYKIRL
ncbi:MAG: Resolvase protein [Sporomusa sp.]|jgi:DNA invertase Pin-like site-specific DNA recombinase|nr:Resolvase protein [Sporomusa sp.]